MSAIQQVLFGSGGGVRFSGIVNRDIRSFGTFGATASYGLNQGSITVIEGLGGGQFATIDQWVAPNSAASNYQVRAIQAPGGSPVSGTLNTWVNLGGNIQWFLNVDAIETNLNYRRNEVFASLFIEIRKTLDNQVVSSATITLNAVAEGTD
jgi:hypothetical protein